MTKEEEILSQQIFFVGENISRYYFSKFTDEGKIVLLKHYNLSGGDEKSVAGCGVLANLDPAIRTHLIRKHASRIAARLYRSPGIGLTGLSAISDSLLGDTLNLVNMSGTPRQSRGVGGAFFVAINNIFGASSAFSLQKRTVSDDVGDFSWYAMPYEGVLLTSFSYDTKKSERLLLRPVISTEDRVQMLRKLVVKHDGDIKSAWRSIWQTAKLLNVSENNVRQIKNFIIQQSRGQQVSFPKVRLDVSINGVGRVGQIVSVKQKLDSEAAWRQEMALPMVSFGRAPAFRFPVFLETLLPERLGVVDDADRSRLYPLFGRYHRYLNNITVRHVDDDRKGVPKDIHVTTLDAHSDLNGVFNGKFLVSSGVSPSALLSWLSAQSEMPEQPAIPGVQDKIAMSLDAKGALSIVDGPGKPFTHILKFGCSSQMEAIPAGEWFCAQLMQSAGINTAKSALIEINPEVPLCFLSERFDIFNSAKTGDYIVFEDGCALTVTPIHRKYSVPMEALASRILAACGRKEDGEQMLRQVAASFFVGNTDAHARNFGVLTIDNGNGVPVSRLAPAFDVVCTIGLPWISSAPALPINKSRVYNMDSFVFLGNALGLSRDESIAVVTDVSSRMKSKSESLLANLPDIVAKRDRVVSHLQYIDRLVEMSRDHLFSGAQPTTTPSSVTKRMR